MLQKFLHSVEKLKKKWNIRSNWDFLLINLVFALAGMMIVHERQPIFAWIGITSQTPLWVKILVYIPLIVPLYQLNLLIFSLPLGQFYFFWEKEKRLARFLRRIVSGK